MEEIFVGDYVVRADRYYTKDHLWVKIRGNKATIGITDFTARALEEVDSLELPQKDIELETGDVSASIEFGDEVINIITPLSGVVIDVNKSLDEDPSELLESPYDDGWLYEIEISDTQEIEDLISAEDYAQLLSELTHEPIYEETEEELEEPLENIPDDEFYEDKP
ncbi:MAG: glycine cleavage system protein H [Aquificaceae bacterium]|nr:glycine cleavage system protein H [Aquificaceae bacterium]MDW8237557.1 glycine cleavage system protein H [Aquificaceae bacterium]